MNKFKKPEPLKISCTATDCDNDLHCFKAARGMAKSDHGKCRACNADLVDWSRIHTRSIDDAGYTFNALKNETIRHHFFHIDIDLRARNYAHRKGRKKLAEAIENRIGKYLAVAEPYRDGQQTPFSGNPIFYAQHATAVCCRTCLQYWHGIPKGRALSDEEFEYCVQLVELYMDERLPDVAEESIKVPPIRN